MGEHANGPHCSTPMYLLPRFVPQLDRRGHVDPLTSDRCAKFSMFSVSLDHNKHAVDHLLQLAGNKYMWY
jgi:hypothetical protein